MAFLRIFSNPGVVNLAHHVEEKFEIEESDQLMVTMWWDLNWMESMTLKSASRRTAWNVNTVWPDANHEAKQSKPPAASKAVLSPSEQPGVALNLLIRP